MDKIHAGVCILAAIVYFNVLEAGFVYDDRRAVLTNPDVVASTPLQNLLYSDFWGTPLYSSNSHGSYRPLCVFTFRINYLLSGLHPLGYHLVNIILHSITTGLVLETGRIVLPRRCPTVAAILFAVHPIHTEAVTGIVGRADVLACIFYLLSFIMFSKHVKIREQIVFSNLNSKSNLKSYTKNLNNSSSSVAMRFLLFRRNDFIPYKYISEDSLDFYKVYIYLMFSVCFATCATLCKETGLTVLGLCLVYDVLTYMRSKHKCHNCESPRKSSLIILAASSSVLLCLRLYLMGTRLPVFAKADNPTAFNPSALTRTLTFLYLPVENFKLFIYPKWLSFDWSMDSISAITHVSDPRNILTVTFYYIIYRTVKLSLINCSIKTEKFIKRKCNLCFEVNSITHSSFCQITNNNNVTQTCECLRFISGHESVLLCMAFLIIPFLPASNLPFYVGFVLAERVLYLPSIGYCFLFSIGWKILNIKLNKKTAVSLLFVLLLVLGVRTLQRNKDWIDEESLYRSGIPINPAKAYGNLGSILSTQGRVEEAEAALRMALWHRPNMADVHYNLANLQRGLKQFKEAIESYKMAIKFRPSLAVAYLNLGHLLASLGKYDEAEGLLRKCSQLDSTGLKDVRSHQETKTSALLHLGRLYSEWGKFHEAVKVLKEAVNTRPDYYQPQMLYSLLADALEKTDRHAEAEVWYKAALINSNHDIAYPEGRYLLKNRTTTLEF